MNHFGLVAQKFKPAQATADDMHKVDGFQAQYIHATMGMAGEWLELSIATGHENFLEEAGDFLFFYRAAAILVGYEPASNEYVEEKNFEYQMLTLELTSRVNQLFDWGKKCLCYNKPLPTNEDIITQLAGMEHMFYALIRKAGLSLTQIEEYNDAKLNKRYKAGYSNAEAQARNDKE